MLYNDNKAGIYTDCYDSVISTGDSSKLILTEPGKEYANFPNHDELYAKPKTHFS